MVIVVAAGFRCFTQRLISCCEREKLTNLAILHEKHDEISRFNRDLTSSRRIPIALHGEAKAYGGNQSSGNRVFFSPTTTNTNDMKNPTKVGVAGLGMMGQMHLSCYGANPRAQVVGVYSRNAANLGERKRVEGNIANSQNFDLSGMLATADFEDLLRNPDIDLIDICLPTRQHAGATIAALNAGKHVICEKPLAWDEAECDQIIEAQRKSGKFLLIGHCLRFWPQYVRASEILASGELGAPLYARFDRSSGAPIWSRWLMDGEQSGGVVLDMHVHDIDTALWWFGTPQNVRANGVIRDGLPLKVDATWRYENGPLVQIHGGWDRGALPFRMAFEVMCEGGTIVWDSTRGETLSVFRGADEEKHDFDGTMGYAPQIDYFLSCIERNEAPKRATPEQSRESVKWAREELRQMCAATPTD